MSAEDCEKALPITFGKISLNYHTHVATNRCASLEFKKTGQVRI